MGQVQDLFQGVQTRQAQSAALAGASVDDNPDDAAEAINIGNMSGVPSPAVYNDLGKFRTAAKSTLSGDIVRSNAMIADYIASHPLAAKVSNDDWANLDTISQGAQSTSQLVRLLNAPRQITSEALSEARQGFRAGWGAAPGQAIYSKYPEFYDAHPAAFVAMALPWVPFEVAGKLFSAIGSATVSGVEGAAKAAHLAMFGDKTAAENFGSDAAYLAEYLMGKGEMPRLPALYAPHLHDWMANGYEPPRGIDPVVDQGKAQVNAAVVQRLEDDLVNAQTSTTKERSLESFKTFSDLHYGDSTFSIHGDAVSALYGDKVPEPNDGLLGWVPGIGDKLMAAHITGDDVHIPIKDWLTHVDPVIAKTLHDDIRVWPGGITAREATEVNVPKGTVESPLAAVRAASSTEPMFSIGDRKLTLKKPSLEDFLKQNEHQIEDEEDVKFLTQRYNEAVTYGIDKYQLLDDKGNVVGMLNATPNEGKLFINSIYSVGDFGPNDFGPSLIRELGRQLKALYPQLLDDKGRLSITGDRVTGARWGKAMNVLNLDDFSPDVKFNVNGLRDLLSDAHTASKLVDYAGMQALIEPLSERAERLNKAVEDELRRMAGGAFEVVPASKILTQFGETAEGAFVRRQGLLPVLLYDVFGPNPIGTARHEGMHVLISSMTHDERLILGKAAIDEGWLQKHNIEARYKNYGPDVKLEEAVVEEYREWAASQVPHPNPGVHGIFEGLKAFWEGLKQRLNEVFGGERTWEDLFRKIHEGRLAGRQANLQALSGFEPKFSLNNEFERIRNSVHGLDIKSYRRIQELVKKQYDEDLAAAQSRAERDQARRQSKEWRDNTATMRSEVEETIRQRPDVAADLFLGTGELAGQKLRQRYTLAADDLTAEQKAGLPAHYVSRNGLPVDQVAGMFGYRAGDAMVDKLIEYNSLKEGRSPRDMFKHIVDRETDRQMEAKYGRLQDNIMTEAHNQAFSETNLERMAEEMYAVALSAKVDVIGKAEAKEEIQNQFKNKIISQINSNRVRDEVGRNGRDAERAAIAGDWAEVARNLQRKYLNSLEVAESLKLEKERAAFDKQAKSLSKNVIPGMDPEYTNYIHQILDMFGKKVYPSMETVASRIEGRGTGNLQDFVAAKSAMQREVPVWPELYRDFRKEYSQLTVDEFRAVRDSIKTLAFHGRDELKLIKAGEAQDKAELKGEIINNISQFTKKHYDRKAQRWIGPIPPGVISDAVRAYGVSHFQVPTMLERMDHGDPGGPLSQYVTRPLVEGYGNWMNLKKEFSKILLAADDGLNMKKAVDNDLFKVPGQNDFMNLDRGSLRVVMLNLGTNLKQLSGGYKIDPSAILSWVNKHATQEDWNWVGKIWDMFERRRDLSDEMYRSLTGGVEAERLKGVRLDTPFGPVEGRYFPIIHHPDFEGTSLKLIGGIEAENYVRASTPAGYMKARTGYQAPLALDLDMLPGRLSQELRDIALRPAVIEASKVFWDHDIREAIRIHMGKEWVNQLQPYLKDIANGGNYIPKDQKAMASALEFLRINLMNTLVGGNIGTVMKHGPTAWALSMKEVGASAFFRGMGEVGTNGYLKAVRGLFSTNDDLGEGRYRYMMEHSNIMPFRGTHFEETLTGATQKLIGQGALDTMRQRIIKLSTAPLALSDFVSAAPTWFGAFDEATREGLSEGDAIYLADRAVQRAHGSSSMVYKPSIVRNLSPWFTGFYTLFSNVMQRQMEMVWDAGDTLKLVREGQKSAAMANVPGLIGQLFVYALVPAIVEELVSPLATSDHDSWGKKAAKQIFGGLAYGLSSSWIGIRDAMHTILQGGDPTVGLFSTAFKDFGNVISDIGQATGLKHQPQNRAHAQKVIEDASSLLGLATGLPGGQAGRTAAFGYGYAQGIEHPMDGWDWVHGIRHGTVRERRAP